MILLSSLLLIEAGNTAASCIQTVAFILDVAGGLLVIDGLLLLVSLLLLAFLLLLVFLLFLPNICCWWFCFFCLSYC
jgi:hypothetical protein